MNDNVPASTTPIPNSITGISEAPKAPSTPAAPKEPATQPKSEPIAAKVPEKPTEKQPEKELDSVRLNQLMKKEARLVQEREQFKKEREQYLKEAEETKKWTDMRNEFERLKSSDPIQALKFAGFSETDLMNFLSSNQEEVTPEQKAVKLAQQEINKFKEEQAKKEKDLLDAQEKSKREQESKILEKFQSDIAEHIASDSEKYELCNFYGQQAQDLVYEVISTGLRESNEMLSIDEAAKMVEEYFEEQANQMISLKKLAPKQPKVVEKPVEKPAEAPIVAKESHRLNSTRTITDKNGAAPVKSIGPRVYEQNLTHEQNRQRIIEKYSNMKIK